MTVQCLSSYEKDKGHSKAGPTTHLELLLGLGQLGTHSSHFLLASATWGRACSAACGRAVALSLLRCNLSSRLL